ncbi:hypothetical protein GALMADRAFT_143349 [Galerina marginata CBS 339.88]|uniref:BTB domain-containing protein n=1 Tax=Galerina marginata (strain CBS 339.88) TaxID=685588 RepID=A0A067SWF8_GALM3|nr:hypothetical protein GALMADRAFT_143349 [Galerina marginata CBS 339.88]
MAQCPPQLYRPTLLQPSPMRPASPPSVASQMVVSAQEATKPWLESVAEKAGKLWQDDLETLYLDAENQFPDISWDMVEDKGDEGKLSSKVWGHTAMVHARATAEFRGRYPPNCSFNVSSDPGHTSFTRELRAMHTVGPSPHDLSDERPEDAAFRDIARLDRLRKDMLYIWGSSLHTDVAICLLDSDGSRRHAARSHRFLLSSRSSYFRRLLLANDGETTTKSTIYLPTRHFPPGSLHIILGYLYTGSLGIFRHDLSLLTGFDLIKGALYLSLPVLEDLVRSEIIVEMLHGLYLANLSDAEYFSLTGGEWITMANLGCRCWDCTNGAFRILQFCQEDGIQEDILDRGARRALVALFGEGWCIEEFSALPQSITDSIVTNIKEIITPINVLPLLFAAENALIKLDASYKSLLRLQAVKPMILSVRGSLEKVLCESAGTCLQTQTWNDIMVVDEEDHSQLRYENLVKVGWTLEALSRGASPQNALGIHQALEAHAQSWIALGPSLQSFFERTQNYLLKMSQHSPVAQLAQYGASSSISPLLDKVDTNSLNSSSGSFYSAVSTPTRALSLGEPIDATHSAYIAAIEAEKTISLYSVASSRTNSTDYGLYFTRWAISQETIRESGSIWSEADILKS